MFDTFAISLLNECYDVTTCAHSTPFLFRANKPECNGGNVNIMLK